MAIKLAVGPEFCEALESADAWRPRFWPDAKPILNVRTPMMALMSFLGVGSKCRQAQEQLCIGECKDQWIVL